MSYNFDELQALLATSMVVYNGINEPVDIYIYAAILKIYYEFINKQKEL